MLDTLSQYGRSASIASVLVACSYLGPSFAPAAMSMPNAYVSTDGDFRETEPADWESVDIGAPWIAGATAKSGDDFSVTSTGYGIWSTADQFRFVYKRLTGDGEISTCIRSLTYIADWVKSGVMVRENLHANSPHAFMFLSAGWGVYFQQRLVSGGETGTAGGGAGAAPHCLRLTRTGDRFNAYESVDASHWTLVGTESVVMGQTVYVGLVVTSWSDAGAAMAEFTRVSLTGNAGSDGTPSQPPQVTPPPSDTPPPAPEPSDNPSIPSTTSSPRGLIFDASTDHDTLVTSYRVEFFTAGSDANTATPVLTHDIGKPSPINGEIEVDVASIVEALSPGSYVTIVSATGPGGTTRSAPSPAFVR